MERDKVIRVNTRGLVVRSREALMEIVNTYT